MLQEFYAAIPGELDINQISLSFDEILLKKSENALIAAQQLEEECTKRSRIIEYKEMQYQFLLVLSEGSDLTTARSKYQEQLITHGQEQIAYSTRGGLILA